MLDLTQSSRDATDAANASYCKKHLEQLDRARYAAIVVTHEVQLPATEGGTTYESSYVKGAAVLYEIDNQRLRAPSITTRSTTSCTAI